MFPGLPSVDVTDVTELPGAMRAALAYDGPSVVSVECSADEIPPFAPFLDASQQHSTQKEMTHDVAARA
jgi:acetolactate synthase-1/2/3 large subunit